MLKAPMLSDLRSCVFSRRRFVAGPPIAPRPGP